MKKIVVTMSAFLLFHSCATIQTWFKPKGFTYLYDGKYTGIDSLLNIDGYYYNDSSFEAILLYRDGTIATDTKLKDDYEFDKQNNKSQFTPRWGVFRYITGDTIKAQTILYFGGLEPMRTGFYTYVIKSKCEIEYYSRGYYLNNTSFFEKILKTPLYYHPYPNRIDSAHWVKKRKWFWNKKAWKNRKK